MKPQRPQIHRTPSASKRFIAWARVSSARQHEEGWSLDFQKERLQEYSDRCGGTIVKMYVVVETASKQQERQVFQEMLSYARTNASTIDALLVMKIDRAARNMRDWMALEALEDEYGVKLVSVTQQTENTPAGKMMRRTFATFAAYFTDELSDNVRKSMKRRAEAGLFVTLAPFGYRNVKDADGKRRGVDVDPIQSAKVQRIFHLYAYCGHTLDSLRQALFDENTLYTSFQPKFTRSKLHEMLTDRSYIGEVDHLGQWHPGKQTPLIDRPTFDRVQALLGNRTQRAHLMLYAGSLIKCGHCGRPISGEVKTKLVKSTGEYHQYTYYRCSQQYTQPGHPQRRIPERIFEQQILALFDRLRVQDDDVRHWMAEVIRANSGAAVKAAKEQRAAVDLQLAKVRGQKDGLLNLRIAGEVDAETYNRKIIELIDREQRLILQIDAAGREQTDNALTTIRVFELSQQLKTQWVNAEYDAKRRILEIICLNWTLNDVTLFPTMRQPFDVLAEGVISTAIAQDRTRTCTPCGTTTSK